MPTYKEYLAQIAKLQSLAELARLDEIEDARQQIKALMTQAGLSPEDFSKTPKKATVRGNAVRIAAKYKDPTTGKTWTGRGRTPRWLDGKKKDDFLI
jgi:DNA-binding protein H-NS